MNEKKPLSRGKAIVRLMIAVIVAVVVIVSAYVLVGQRASTRDDGFYDAGATVLVLVIPMLAALIVGVYAHRLYQRVYPNGRKAKAWVTTDTGVTEIQGAQSYRPSATRSTYSNYSK